VKNPETVKPVMRITGTGRGIPEKVLTNADFEKMVDTTDEWITTRTGIKERHILETGGALSELATEAAKKALDEAGRSPEEVDYIIIGTVTGDMKFPATANFVQAALGAVNATTFDISAACSGFMYAIELADSLIRSGKAEVVVTIGAEALSSITDYEDRSTCVLFGDGAGAAVFEATDEDRGVLSTYTGSNGKLHHLLYMEGAGSRYPSKDRDLPKEVFTLKMAGNEVFKHAVKTMGDAAVTALDKAGLDKADIDLLIPHQANIRIIDATTKRLKLSPDNVFRNIHKYGNTSSASIPIALDEARKSGRAKEGDLVLCVSFGGGFTWGSCAIKL